MANPPEYNYESDNEKDNQQRSFQPDRNGEAARNVVSDNLENRMQRNEIIALTKSSGLQDGETYDTITGAPLTDVQTVLQYDLSGICQFQIEVNFIDGEEFTIVKRICEFDLLQEDGFRLLQEDGFALRTQGLVP